MIFKRCQDCSSNHIPNDALKEALTNQHDHVMSIRTGKPANGPLR
jgi:hypothetical protein